MNSYVTKSLISLVVLASAAIPGDSEANQGGDCQTVHNWTGGVTLQGEFVNGQLAVDVVDMYDGTVYCPNVEQGGTCDLGLWPGVNALQIKGDIDTEYFAYYTAGWGGRLSQIYWNIVSVPWGEDEAEFDFVAVGSDNSASISVEGDPIIVLHSGTCGD